MYNILTWLDHAITPERTYTMHDNGDGTVTLTPYGTVIQQGTNMSAANFNNIEEGAFDANLGGKLMLFLARQHGDRLDAAELDLGEFLNEVTAEEKTVTLTNSQKYPGNGSKTTVSLTTVRATTNYTVEAEVTAFSGNVGEVVISDKQLNGFKVEFTGSASSVTIKLKIRGGIIA